ncbi:hypothetical protein F5148DRAFT_514921 [Russula earlei]|uniref:Uncharacterized protein n=1 Tax=Russula earlei TaxID=71964 RepID=A0ACC0TXP3_9AGAM|nr:hypothetical protein F5148DRAFT_514921 [Russula earlei]
MFAVRAMQMPYRYQYTDSHYPQDSISPTTPGGGSNPSTPVNNPWDFDSAPNPAQQPQDSAPSTSLTSLHPAEFSPQELFSTPAAAAVSSPTVIQLEERIPVVPSQYHRSRFRAASGESRLRTHVQKDASSAASEQPAGASSSGTAPSSGLMRVSLTNVRAERTRAHPYRRPRSAGAVGAVSRASSAGDGRTGRSVSDQTRTSPFTGENDPRSARMSPPSAVSGTAVGQPGLSPKVYSIRTDIYFNIDTNTMTAMLELPGVKHSDLSVTLSTEPYTHARQITIAGQTHPPFGDPAPEERERIKRERKFGEFLRRLHVPPHTQVCSQKCTGHSP